jgi:medium-chain acyl-[acyl-carrier-protein] hydrolase
VLPDGLSLRYENPFVRRAALAAPRARLLCLPHAGAGASAFADWPALLAPEIEVAAIQLPGREDRISEPAATDVVPLVRSLVQAVRPYLAVPTALFGHSGGGALAFELATALGRQLRREPARLFISGEPAPGVPRRQMLHLLDDEEFAAALGELGGTPDGLLADEHTSRVILPALRADFALWETHDYSERPPLAAAITVFGGDQDTRVTRDDLAGWRAVTTGPFRLHLFPGGHFFLRACLDQLIEQIRRDLVG